MKARVWLGVTATLLLAGSMSPPASAGGDIELQGLIDAAAPGAVIRLAAGTYRGAVTIDRPLTLEGESGVIIDAHGMGSAVEVTGSDVTLRGLTIRGTGISLTDEDAAISADGAARLVVEDCVIEDALFGVFLRQSADAVVRRSVIGAKDLDPARRGDALRLWESHGATIEGNVVAGGRDSVAYFSNGAGVRDNHFIGGRYGLHFMSSSGITIERNLVEGNSVGIYLMYSSDVELHGNVLAGNQGPSGYGLGLKDVDGLVATDNRFVGNRVGIYFDNAPVSPLTTHRFSGNLFAFNDVGLLFNPSVHGNLLTGNAFVENLTHVSLSGTGTLRDNTWSDQGVGNYWDDFRGYDADRDGVGDVAYRSDDLYSVLADRHPQILLFAGTPAARAIDFAARLFPTIRPEPQVIDEAPLVSMPTFEDPFPGAFAPESPRLLMVSVVMLALSVLAVGTAIRRRRAS